jgi:NitT/TauT family transport system substrate-binding protein
MLLVLLTAVVALGAAVDATAQKPELAEFDAWLVRDPQMSAQFAVADQMGFFKAEGLKVNPRWYVNGPELPSMWGAGNIHVATATATMLVPIAASGQAIYNIAPQSDIAGTQQVILGKKGQELVRSPKDFEKLKIGMPKGASITMAIQKMAKDAGVDFSKILNAVKQAGGKVYFTGNKSHIPGKEGEVDWLLVHAGVVVSGKMLKENPNTLRAMLRALRKATDAINTQREQAVEIVAREMKMDKALARDIMALNVYSMEMNEKVYRGMGEFVDFLHSLNRIPSKFPADQVFYTKLLEEVDPTLVKWKAKTEVR